MTLILKNPYVSKKSQIITLWIQQQQQQKFQSIYLGVKPKSGA